MNDCRDEITRKARAAIEQIRRIAPREQAWTSLLRECADELEAVLFASRPAESAPKLDRQAGQYEPAESAKKVGL